MTPAPAPQPRGSRVRAAALLPNPNRYRLGRQSLSSAASYPQAPVAGPGDGGRVRVWSPSRPLSVGSTLSALRRGSADPCMRVEPGELVWRATRTPEGPALLRLWPRPRLGEVEATAWGPGADWVLDGVPDLLGEQDDPAGFEPLAQHPRLLAALRARPGWRVPRSRAVFESLVPAALEQRVTGREARAAWRSLVVRYGEPAPGPGQAAGLFVPPEPEVWRQIPSWVWLKAGVDEARRRAVIAASQVAARLEETLEMPHAEAASRLRTVPGVGIWTAAEIRQRAHGDPDAFSWMDFHVARNVSWALVGTVLDDVACAEVIEPYRGHRYRVQRLLEMDGATRPRRAPRMTRPTHLPR